jgi:hypothetical protein
MQAAWTQAAWTRHDRPRPTLARGGRGRRAGASPAGEGGRSRRAAGGRRAGAAAAGPQGRGRGKRAAGGPQGAAAAGGRRAGAAGPQGRGRRGAAGPVTLTTAELNAVAQAYVWFAVNRDVEPALVLRRLMQRSLKKGK